MFITHLLLSQGGIHNNKSHLVIRHNSTGIIKGVINPFKTIKIILVWREMSANKPVVPT